MNDISNLFYSITTTNLTDNRLLPYWICQKADEAVVSLLSDVGVKPDSTVLISAEVSAWIELCVRHHVA